MKRNLKEKKSYQPARIAFVCIAILMSAAFVSCGNDGSGSGATAALPAATAIATSQTGPVRFGMQEVGMSVGDNLALLTDQALDDALADMSALGIDWLRFDVSWDMIQPDDNNQYIWSRTDRVVTAARRHGIKSLPILAYTPKWARSEACKEHFQCAPADPAKFAAFAGEAVKHYKPMGVNNWEIWNEPNIEAYWQPVPDAAAYTDLLKAAYTAIKQVDPQSTVISGGLSPAENQDTRIAPIDFLKGMYQNGAREYFDALGFHPVSYPAFPSEVLTWSNWSQMSDLNPSIRSVMIDNGDGEKKIWATEYGVPTDGLDTVNETLQALTYRDLFLQMSDKPWLAALFFHTYRDYASDPDTVNSFFGIIRKDGSKKPAYNELKDILEQRERTAP